MLNFRHENRFTRNTHSGTLCGWALLLAVLVLGNGCGPSAVDTGLSGYDLSGNPVRPFQEANATGTVLAFVAIDCPISNRYTPELKRLRERFAPHGITLWMVYPDKDTTAASVRNHVLEFKLGDRILRDPNHTLVKAAHVRTTPEVAVFGKGGVLVYHGQIDDRFVALGTERPEPTHKDLEVVLDALVNGRPILTKETTAVGCPIAD